MHKLTEEDRKDVIKCKINIYFVFLKMKQAFKTVVDLLICCYANRKNFKWIQEMGQFSGI